MAILKNEKVDSAAWQKLVLSLNRGGLWSVTLPAVYIFLKTGNYFRQSTLNVGLHKIDIVRITLKSSMYHWYQRRPYLSPLTPSLFVCVGQPSFRAESVLPKRDNMSLLIESVIDI